MPANPDSIGVRVVQVDAPADKPWDEPLSPTTEGFKVAAIFLIDPSNNDQLVALWRDGDDLRLRDVTNPGTAAGGFTLAEVLAGGSGLTAGQHRTLRQLIHFINDGPAEGFASGAHRERLPSGSVFATSITWYTDVGKTEKIVERLMTWAGITMTVEKWKIYDTDGSTVLWTVSDAVSFTGIFETTRTRTITAGDA